MCRTFSVLLVLLSLLASTARAGDKAATDKAPSENAAAGQAKARAILEKAILAHGGEAVLGKFVAAYCKVAANDFSDDKKIPHGFEMYIEGDEKMRLLTFEAQEKKPISIEVINGQEGWLKEGDEPAADVSDQLESERETVYINWATMLVPLRKPGFRLSTLKEISVDGHKAEGILISHDKHRPLKFYFDKESHLLVKCERMLKKSESENEGTEETVWSDFQEIQGTKQAMKASILWDGVEVSEAKTTELKFYEKSLDEKLFAKP